MKRKLFFLQLLFSVIYLRAQTVETNRTCAASEFSDWAIARADLDGPAFEEQFLKSRWNQPCCTYQDSIFPLLFQVLDSLDRPAAAILFQSWDQHSRQLLSGNPSLPLLQEAILFATKLGDEYPEPFWQIAREDLLQKVSFHLSQRISNQENGTGSKQFLALQSTLRQHGFLVQVPPTTWDKAWHNLKEGNFAYLWTRFKGRYLKDSLIVLLLVLLIGGKVKRWTQRKKPQLP